MTLENFQKENHLYFKNRALLEEALTHSSYAKQYQGNVNDNERLEFFGDAVLKLLVSEHLFLTYPELNEGALTKKRAYLVSDTLLARLANSISLGAFIRLSHSEKRAGGNERSSILANAMEALLGAIYLDSGYEACKAFFVPLIKTINLDKELKTYNNKTVLQEWTQKRGLPLPCYTIKKTHGPDHNKVFYVTVSITTKKGLEKTASGSGTSKKEAEQEAARLLFEQL